MKESQLVTRLLAEKQRWEATALQTVDQACTDSQSNSILRTAEAKQRAIVRSLQRITDGTFGRCSQCGTMIEPERLELLLDNDCHTCAACARTSSAASKSCLPPKQFQRSSRRPTSRRMA